MVCAHCSTPNAPGAQQCSTCGSSLADSGADANATVFPSKKTAAPGGADTPTLVGGRTAVAVATSHESLSGGDATAPPTFQAPIDFGPRYRLEALLGEGGMGAVYRAHDRELDRTVALKLIRPTIAANLNVSQRLKQELLLASKVSHRNILRIHDLGEANGMRFISMAYVEGTDLHQLLVRTGTLPTERAVSIAKQLCGALEAAHREGVVHRDLKPQNILLGKDDHVYVADFGLAKSLEAGLTAMTRSGEVLGTPLYMAPEQVECKPVDHRTDLYALGLIMYEMVTGELPFKADSALQLMFQRVQQKPKDPRAINPEVPPYLARIIMRCLEKDPANRYQSAAEVLHDLEAAQATGGARSVQISVPGISLQMPGRMSWYLWGGAALLLLAIVAVAVPPVRHAIFGRTKTEQTAAEPQNVRYVAVLPFRVQGDEKTGNLVAEGMTEALTAKLFQLKDVRLTSGTESARAARGDSLEQIAKALGATLIVSGTVQASGNRVRIIANLDDAAAHKRVWTAEFPGVSEDLLTLEDQVYAQLLPALSIKPTTEELASTTGHATENVEAYDLYLRGRTAMRGQQDVKNVRKAMGLFEDALKKDPRFALAYTGLAGASLRMYMETKDPQWSNKALATAQRSLELNDQLPQAHAAAGEVYAATGRSAEALAELKRAVDMAPNSDDFYRRLGRAYLDTGRSKEAIEAYRKAVETNPYYWINYSDLGVAYFRLGKYEDASATLRRVIELEPDNADGYNNLASALLGAGEFQQAIEPLEKAIKLTPTADAYSNLGTALFYLKRYPEAVPYFEKAAQMVPNSVIFVGNVGDAYGMTDRQAEAKAMYDKAIAVAYKTLQVNPRDAITMGAMADWYAKEGNAAKAQQFIQQARAIDNSNVDLMYFQAQIYALANDHANALKALEEAFKQGFRPAFAQAEPALGSLTSDPEFQKLVKKYGGK